MLILYPHLLYTAKDRNQSPGQLCLTVKAPSKIAADETEGGEGGGEREGWMGIMEFFSTKI